MDRRTFVGTGLKVGAISLAAGATGLASAKAQAILPPVVQPPVSGYWVDRYLTIAGGTPAPTTPFSSSFKDWVRLQDFAGKPTLVLFWATWCGACMHEMPTLNAMIGREIDPSLMNVVAISIDELPLAQVNSFLQAKGWTNFAHFQDQSRILFDEFG